MVKIVKEAIQRKCIHLYQIYDELISDVPEIEEFKKLLSLDQIGENEPVYSVSFLTKDGIERQKEEIFVSRDEQVLLESLLREMGKKFFLDHYEAYANGEDIIKIVPIGAYTYSSLQTSVSAMRRIFRDDLNLKALVYILSKDNSKLDNASIELAKELIELS